jgi:hypothetical protein
MASAAQHNTLPIIELTRSSTPASLSISGISPLSLLPDLPVWYLDPNIFGCHPGRSEKQFRDPVSRSPPTLSTLISVYWIPACAGMTKGGGIPPPFGGRLVNDQSYL